MRRRQLQKDLHRTSQSLVTLKIRRNLRGRRQVKESLISLKNLCKLTKIQWRKKEKMILFFFSDCIALCYSANGQAGISVLTIKHFVCSWFYFIWIFIHLTYGTHFCECRHETFFFFFEESSNPKWSYYEVWDTCVSYFFYVHIFS